MSTTAPATAPYDDAQGRIWFWIYLAVGLPIAYLYLVRMEAKETAGDRGFRFAIFFLACMWPVLLFAMGVSYLFDRADAGRKPVPPRGGADPPDRPADGSGTK